MHVTRKSGRWLPVRIDDFEKWQASLLEESARRLGAALAPGGRVHRWGFAGSPVTFRGQLAWLRVSPFLEHEMSRKAWRGTTEADAEEYGYLLSATYRMPVPAGCVPSFGTGHIDLNWENITAPRFCILDMEHWCVAVTGYGAAYLYLTALEVPPAVPGSTALRPDSFIRPGIRDAV
jgi:hypothetical protein